MPELSVTQEGVASVALLCHNNAMQTVVKTIKLRIKDKHAGVLRRMARDVNMVWNFANETSIRAIRERGKWLSAYDLQKLTAGYSKCDDVTIGSGTVQLVCVEYATRRKQSKKAGLTPAEAVKVSATNSWQGFKAKWYARLQQEGQSMPPPTRSTAHGGFDQRDYGTGGRL